VKGFATTDDGSDYLYPDTHSFEKTGRIVTVAEHYRVCYCCGALGYCLTAIVSNMADFGELYLHI
jgi:hypothetical protein